MIGPSTTTIGAALAASRLSGNPVELELPDLGSRARAFEVQAAALEAFDDEYKGYTLIGTSPATRTPLGLTGPAHGLITAKSIFADDAVVRLPPGAIGAQCEIVFRLGRGFPAPGEAIDTHGAAEAIVACHAAIGVVGRRLRGAAHTDLTAIADFALHVATVIGRPAQIDERVLDEAKVEARIDGNVVASARGAALMGGHPLEAVTWLATQLREEERDLDAGQYVATGSITPVLQVLPGQLLDVSIEHIGTVRCRFA